MYEISEALSMSDDFHGLSSEDLDRMAGIFERRSFLVRTTDGGGKHLRSLLEVDLNQIGTFTLEEMAIITEMSPLTLRQYVREGKIKAHKKWREYMVTANEIARFMYQRETGKKVSPEVAIGVAVIERDRGYMELDYKNILEYRFFNPLDMKNWFGNEDRYIDRILNGAHQIELIPEFEHFFIVAGLLPQPEIDDDPSLEDTFRVDSNKLHIFYDRINYEQWPTKSEALRDIREIFGELNDESTLLKMYRELWVKYSEFHELSLVWNHSKEEIENLKDEIHQLKAKLAFKGES
jgi:hypothetical protein